MRASVPADVTHLPDCSAELRNAVQNFSQGASAHLAVEERIQRELPSDSSWNYPANRIRFSGSQFSKLMGKKSSGRPTLSLDDDRQAFQAGHELTFDLDYPIGACQ